MSIQSTGRMSGLWRSMLALTALGLLAASPGVAADDAAGPPQQLIVKFKDAPPGLAVAQRHARADRALAAVADRLAVQLEYRRPLAIGADVVRVGAGRAMSEEELEQLAAEVAAQPDVEYAEVDRLLKPLATPNDSMYNQQWHYFESTGGSRLPTAWDTTNGSGVRVAVIDTGYRPHADLAANIVGGYDFISDTFVANDGGGRDSDARDPGDWMNAGQCGGGYPPSFASSSWHGTHVAGTVAAVTNNSTGVAGVAYGAKVVPIRVLGKCGGLTSDIADAIVWAAGGSVSGVPSNPYPARVINMSLGGGGSCSSTMQSAINSARSNNAVVVVAAGNEATNAANSMPANCSGVIAVAATNRSGGRAYYSNYGNVVDLAAPGGDVRVSGSNGILSTLNTGTTTPGSDTYAFYQGTSMAAPHVAGVAALVLSVNSALTPDGVESLLKSTARPFPASCSGCGVGIVDAAAAVAAAGGGGGPGPGDGELQNGVPVTGLSGSSGTELRFTLEVPSGATNLVFQISGGSGDADLYVRRGSPPTTSQWDCRPYRTGNNESCSFSSPASGTWHVMVRGYTSFSGVTLTASYNGSSGGGGDLQDGVPLTGLSGSAGSQQVFTVVVPSGTSSLSIQMSGGSVDADLYARSGTHTTTPHYDLRPYLNGNNESCSFSSPPAGTWYVMVRGYSSYSGVSLVANY